MRKVFLCFNSICFFFTISVNTSNSLDFGKHFYGHAFCYFGIGIEHQGGDIWRNKLITRELAVREYKDQLREMWDDYLFDDEKEFYGTVDKYIEHQLNEYFNEYISEYEGTVKAYEDIFANLLIIDIKFMFNFGIGYNFYWKAFKNWYPFIGFDLSKHFSIGIKDLYGVNDIQEDFLLPTKKEVITFLSRIGIKHYVSPIFSLQVYGLLGLTVNDVGIKYATYLDLPNYNERVIGFATGCGLETIIKERFIFGVEYRYLMSRTKKIDLNTLDDLKIRVDMSSNVIMVKFGIQFL